MFTIFDDIYMEPRKIIRDRIIATKKLWELYRTDRKKFVEALIEQDGPEWPKYMLTRLGQGFRVDEDGFVWNTSG